MEPDPITSLIQAHIAFLREQGVDVQCAILYGSVAKGTARPGSDVDLLVLAGAETVPQALDACKVQQEKRGTRLHIHQDLPTGTALSHIATDVLTPARAEDMLAYFRTLTPPYEAYLNTMRLIETKAGPKQYGTPLMEVRTKAWLLEALGGGSVLEGEINCKVAAALKCAQQAYDDFEAGIAQIMEQAGRSRPDPGLPSR